MVLYVDYILIKLKEKIKFKKQRKEAQVVITGEQPLITKDHFRRNNYNNVLETGWKL